MNRKKNRVVVIDYQMSNLFSVQNACNYVGMNAIITSDKNIIMKADAAILPGVGAFGNAMSNLKKLDLIGSIQEFIQMGKPFMGVCLGMQLLFTESEEFGYHKGLDIIKGKVKKFSKSSGDKIPQIGWNKINKVKNDKTRWKASPLREIKDDEYAYFVHSYFVEPEDKDVVLSVTRYADIDYCSSIISGNIFATQFHPEKSGQEGIKIYKTWAELIKKR